MSQLALQGAADCLNHLLYEAYLVCDGLDSAGDADVGRNTLHDLVEELRVVQLCLKPLLYGCQVFLAINRLVLRALVRQLL